MLKKIIITLLLISFIATAYFAFSVFTKRSHDLIVSHEEEIIDHTPSVNDSPPPNDQKNDNTEDTSKNETITDDQSDITEKNDTTGSFYINITPLDCMRECEPYRYDSKELEYCQNVCGLSEKSSTTDCDKLKGLAKDYCYKDQAIEKKDMVICDNIIDEQIQETCKNRIQEDILENM